MLDIQAMHGWINAESAGHYFFYAFPVCVLLLLPLMKERRVRFLIPSVLISLIIVNPWFFKYWEDLGLYAYWRILWVVPVLPVIAALVPAVAEKAGSVVNKHFSINRSWLNGLCRFMITAIGIVGIFFGGSFIYNTSRGQFEISAANGSKIPGYVVEIADRLASPRSRYSIRTSSQKSICCASKKKKYYMLC